MQKKEILIIKVGSSTLTNRDGGLIAPDIESFSRLGEEILAYQSKGYSIIIVSSAAVTAGMAKVGLSERPSKDSSMPELQRLASIGWRHVLNQWSVALNDQPIGELLITKREVEADKESGELLRVIERLLHHETLCIVNENDAITHEEIAFGDNDTLAAQLAAKISTSSLFNATVKLIILSDIHGVYSDKNDSNTVIKTIDDIEAFSHLAGGAGTSDGTGGMHTKFVAASIAKQAGVQTWIGNGRTEQIITQLLNGQAGTHFS